MFWRLKTLGMFLYLTLLLVGLALLFSFILGATPYLYVGMMLVISVLLSFYSYFGSKKMALRANGAKIVTEEEYPRLYRIIRSVAEKANVPMPEVGVVDTPSLNAFATGRNPKNAAVVVTMGLLRTMPDDELEGVIAHEMAHVKNRDILVMSVASAVASIISIVARYGIYIAMAADDRKNALAVIVSLVAMIFIPIAAILVQLAISRKREYLADQTGANFTGNPMALANALRRIGGLNYDSVNVERTSRNRSYESRTPSKTYDAYAHLWISSPAVGKKMSKLFSTHPPIEERIERLEKMAKSQ